MHCKKNKYHQYYDEIKNNIDNDKNSVFTYDDKQNMFTFDVVLGMKNTE